MAKNQFVGTWRLISAEYRTADGQVIYPYDEDPVGYIMYNEDGYMSVAFMSRNRPGFASGDKLAGTTEEKTAAIDTYQSYCGRYEVREHRVIHHVEVSLFPNSVGTDQERIFEFDGDRLLLSTPPFLLGGTWRTGHLIWRRT